MEVNMTIKIEYNKNKRRGRKKTFVTLKSLPENSYKLFKRIREQFGYNICLNRLRSLLTNCITMTDLFLEDCKQKGTDRVHINLSDEVHQKTFPGTTQAATILKRCLALGVLNREEGAGPKTPNSQFYARKQIYKKMKHLLFHVQDWTDKDFKNFIKHLDLKQKEWEKQKKLMEKVAPKIPIAERQKKFFKGMEITGVEFQPLNNYINTVIDNKGTLDTNYKVDWDSYYKEKCIVETEDLMEMLKCSLSNGMEVDHREASKLADEILE